MLSRCTFFNSERVLYPLKTDWIFVAASSGVSSRLFLAGAATSLVLLFLRLELLLLLFVVLSKPFFSWWFFVVSSGDGDL